MKSYIIILLLCGGTFALGYVVGSNRHRPTPVTEAVVAADASPAQPQTPTLPETTIVSRTEPARITPPKPVEPAPVTAPQMPETSTNVEAAPQPTALSRAIDTLVSPETTPHQRRALLNQLRESGQLDPAIEALKQGAAKNPTSAAWQAVLGQAELQKAGQLARSGASVNEMGIIGMQADQSFDAALKIDPSNWDAQFYKAVAMSYWPAEMKKGDEVIQRLSRLVDQQEAQSPQPQFAQTYAVLGDQYQKMGQPDYAAQTWRLGLQRFPTDAALQKKVAGK